MHANRGVDADAGVRAVARELYESTRSLPFVSPYGHVDPRILATDEPFENPTALIVSPDHYVLRMLYARGVSLESLGVPRRDGAPVERDPRAVWKLFARHFHVFRGTPTGVWLDHELQELFDVHERLSADSADRVYDAIAERLASPEFRPRALFERFGIEVLATTDAASDSLEHHAAIQRSSWPGRVIPSFRPDAVFPERSLFLASNFALDHCNEPATMFSWPSVHAQSGIVAQPHGATGIEPRFRRPRETQGRE